MNLRKANPLAQAALNTAPIGSQLVIRQGFQYALRMKPVREARLRRWVGCRRFVYNEALAYQLSEINSGRVRPGFVTLCERLLKLKRQYPWLCDPPAQALQQAMKDLCEAWEKKSTPGSGAPGFRKRGQGESIRLPQGCKYDDGRGVVRVPKLGDLRLRHSRKALGVLKNVTLRQQGKRWIASLQTERIVGKPIPESKTAVGIDFGVVTVMMPSEGCPKTLPKSVLKYEKRQRRLHQAVSRKRLGSRNRHKAIERLARCHQRAAAVRRDFLHKATTEFVHTHALIAIEDLCVRNITASAAGTQGAPGRNVSTKSALNRSILRCGWATARLMLEYKSAWSGVALHVVGPRFTSQDCSACGHRAAENRASRSRFLCVKCGHIDDADRNAAKNILARALGASATSSTSSPGHGLARTAGHAGPHACADGDARRPRPRSAARGVAVGTPLAGTNPALSQSGNRPPTQFLVGDGCQEEYLNLCAKGQTEPPGLTTNSSTSRSPPHLSSKPFEKPPTADD